MRKGDKSELKDIVDGALMDLWFVRVREGWVLGGWGFGVCGKGKGKGDGTCAVRTSCLWRKDKLG